VMIGGVLIALAGVLLRFAPNRNRAPLNRAPQPVYTSAPPVGPIKAVDNKPKQAHPGPYKPEPLKSRSHALKNIVGDTEQLEASELTPGQLMAAERTKSIIVSDRKARDTGETLVADADVANADVTDVGASTEAIGMDEMNLGATRAEPNADDEDNIDEVSLDQLVNDEVANDEVNNVAAQPENPKASENNIVSSAAIPLFQTPPRLSPSTLPTAKPSPAPLAPTPPPTHSKAQFASSPLEWHDNEEEFDFLWSEKEQTSTDTEPALKTLNGLEPKKQNPENS
jgi:hypothetical protein